MSLPYIMNPRMYINAGGYNFIFVSLYNKQV